GLGPAASSGTSPDSSAIVTSPVAMLVAGSCDASTGSGGAEGPDTVEVATTDGSTAAMLVAVDTRGSAPWAAVRFQRWTWFESMPM
ncbi:hypothetical protein C0995_005815, partial [Termitomyces sp. Mi166